MTAPGLRIYDHSHQTLPSRSVRHFHFLVALQSQAAQAQAYKIIYLRLDIPTDLFLLGLLSKLFYPHQLNQVLRQPQRTRPQGLDYAWLVVTVMYFYFVSYTRCSKLVIVCIFS